MDFPPLQAGRLERRYKRFLADVRLPDGSLVVAHCPNTGAMTGLTAPDSRVWLSYHDNPARKLRWTLELIETAQGLVCVHSALANKVIGEALQVNQIAPLAGAWEVRPEVRLPGSARVDFVLSRDDYRVIVEVKAVTLLADDGLGLFPDAVSERARKHAQALAASISDKTRAALVFCVFHEGISRVAPADAIDPAYGAALRAAAKAGVEVVACGCVVEPTGIRVTHLLPVEGIERD